VLAKSPMAAARRSIGGPVPRKNEPLRQHRARVFAGRRGTMTVLSSLSEHGPGHSLCPTREAGTASPRNASARGAFPKEHFRTPFSY
jgi:hypothetical protein